MSRERAQLPPQRGPPREEARVRVAARVHVDASSRARHHLRDRSAPVHRAGWRAGVTRTAAAVTAPTASYHQPQAQKRRAAIGLLAPCSMRGRVSHARAPRAPSAWSCTRGTVGWLCVSRSLTRLAQVNTRTVGARSGLGRAPSRPETEQAPRDGVLSRPFVKFETATPDRGVTNRDVTRKSCQI